MQCQFHNNSGQHEYVTLHTLFCTLLSCFEKDKKAMNIGANLSCDIGSFLSLPDVEYEGLDMLCIHHGIHN